MTSFVKKPSSNYRDFFNITKVGLIKLWRTKSLLLWGLVIPTVIIILLSTTLPLNTRAMGLRIGLMVAICVMVCNLLPSTIGNLRISNSFVQFKLSGYRERIILCAMSFAIFIFFWISITSGIVISVIINGGVGFLEHANYYHPISQGHAWLNLFSTYFLVLFCAIAFIPIGWSISSIGADMRILGMATAMTMSFVLIISGTYFNFQTLSILHDGNWKILGDILYILPPGAIYNLIGLVIGMSNPTTGHSAWSFGINDNPVMIILQIGSLILTFIIILWAIKKFFKFSN